MRVLAVDDPLVGAPVGLRVDSAPILMLPSFLNMLPFWLHFLIFFLGGGMLMLLMQWELWPPIWIGLIVWAIFIAWRSKRSRLT
jgi:hypothetical protein